MAMKVRYPKIENLIQMAASGLRFPATVYHAGAIYSANGQIGTHTASGRAVAQYEVDAGDKLWAFSDGTVVGAKS
jgi:hypothetical protein